jgi:hypothetical protein
MYPATAWGIWTMRVLINMFSKTGFMFIAVQFMGKFLKRGI